MDTSRRESGPAVLLQLVLAGLLTVCGLGMTVVSYALVRRWAIHAGYQGWPADLYPAMIIPFVIFGALVLFLADLAGFDVRRLGWAAVVGGGAVTAAMAGGAEGWPGGLVVGAASLCGTAALVGAAKTAAAGLLELARHEVEDGADEEGLSGR